MPSKKGLHAHGCMRCGQRYEDACENTGEDELCYECKTGRQAGWIEGRLARPCCVLNGRSARKDELVTYKLVGRSAWYICPTCKRTHPFKPVREMQKTREGFHDHAA